MKRITMLAAAGALVATPALGAWAAFAGDEAPSTANVRVDDRGRHSNDAEPGDDRGQDHRHGADDATGLVRHSGQRELGDDHGRVGNDDLAGHVRHSGELEPGDDQGGHGELEPGDDHGGDARSGDDPASDSGTGRDDSGGHDADHQGGDDD